MRGASMEVTWASVEQNMGEIRSSVSRRARGIAKVCTERNNRNVRNSSRL
uniref:Uncharacterized protein n=1 Tax=Arion vulgaris TaxID=1028688 RepID=A0A0B6YBK6_9EUPU